MRTLIFPINDDLKNIVAHAAAHDPDLFYGEPIPRSLFLVKDDGAYLMSAGVPMLPNPAHSSGSSRNLVSYAIGHDPILPSYSYDLTRAICGGDDFVEPIDVNLFEKSIANSATHIIIDFADDTITITAEFSSH